MKYLITGGAGFVGSHLAEYLIGRGHSVHVFDNVSTGCLDNVQHLIGREGFRYTIGDILDYDSLQDVVEPCEGIFHLAAAVGVRLIMKQPVETIVTNVEGTANVLKLASHHGRKVLFASTSEVYGKLIEEDGNVARLNEGDNWTLGPTSKRRWAYACSKALDEFLALAYRDEKHLRVVVARFFNIIGPRQTGRYGMVVPNFVDRAVRGEPIQVFGDGNQTRCFTYVRDAVRAVAALMETPEAEGEIFNVGSEDEISMNGLAERVRSLAASPSDIVHVAYEDIFGSGFEDIKQRTPNIAKLKRTIGYKPLYSLDDALRSVIAFYRT